jgi:hypothetical protein
MQTRARRIVVLLATAAFVTVASTAAAQTPAGLMGTWKLNLAKSKFNPGPAPRSMTVVYAPSPKGRMSIVVDLEPAEGAPLHWEVTVADDGKDYPVKGNPNFDSASYKRIDDHTSETTFKKDKKVVATNTRELSADGKTLTITNKGTTTDGKPRIDVQVLEK